ncbi:BON domain-containing protein [Sunxiuqinia indica]|uniref:BON domain-containing protein n=1 Tax=Sunxiuqinia indica TaxID=2692584 RepID=UPI001356DC75|nr:BON domain-containing protein [Sunxiuqinia indica]
MKPLPNEIVKKNIVEQLVWNGDINTKDINIEVGDDKVLLKGTVDSYSSKLEAARETMLIARNHDIENQLVVKFNPKQPVTNDLEIMDSIQNILRWNDGINPVNIQVEAENGKVTLSGTVSRSREKTKAEKIAASAKGVVDVSNQISVKPSTIHSDTEIANDVNRAFERNPLIDTDKIFTEVTTGIIHLSGSVANDVIRKEIHDIALYTDGIVDIVNEITIE